MKLNIAEPGKAGADEPLPFPRRCDSIAKKAHKTFIISAFAGLGCLLLWASLARLDKVARGSGRVIPSLQNQLVQHFEGGIVTDILVKEGDRVKKGDVLLTVKNSFARAELSKARLDMMAHQMQLVRLTAESKGLPEVEFPEELEKAIPDLVENELRLFRRRMASLNEKTLIVEDQIRQRELEYSERKIRFKNRTREYNLIKQRVASLRRLTKVGAVSKNELLDNETKLQQVRTKISDLEHQIPRTRSALSEAKRRRKEIVLQHRSDAEKERSETVLEIAKLEESILAFKDRKNRTEVRAPMDGTVNKLFVSTLGGVVRSGQNLVQLVPADKSIAVEVKLSPKDRAKVWPGLSGIVKVSAYDYSIYGGLKGRITEVSPDALQDENGRPYFRVRMEADVSDFGPDRPVVPGMLAEVDIVTGNHTILDFILKPVRSIRDRALRQ